jgi:hypothetical protein
MDLYKKFLKLSLQFIAYDTMSIPNLDIDRWVQKILKTNKHNIVIQIKPKNLRKYTIL